MAVSEDSAVMENVRHDGTLAVEEGVFQSNPLHALAAVCSFPPFLLAVSQE